VTLRIDSRRLRATVLAGLVLALALAMPSAASAHAELVKATPPDGTTVTTPVSEVSATYSADLTQDSRLGVLDQDGVRIAVGMVDPDDKRRMVATLDQAYVAGTLTVRSTAIADDGHVERTQWTFTIAVPATPTATPVCTDQCPGQSSTRPTASPTTSPSAVPTPPASPASGPTSSGGGDVILPIIAALAIVATAGALLLGRGRGPSSPA
jgi:copper resistance protein C